MQVLLVAAIGALAGFGIWLGITALRGVRVLPDARRLVPEAVPPERAVAWLAAALLAGWSSGW